MSVILIEKNLFWINTHRTIFWWKWVSTNSSSRKWIKLVMWTDTESWFVAPTIIYVAQATTFPRCVQEEDILACIALSHRNLAIDLLVTCLKVLHDFKSLTIQCLLFVNTRNQVLFETGAKRPGCSYLPWTSDVLIWPQESLHLFS